MLKTVLLLKKIYVYLLSIYLHLHIFSVLSFHPQHAVKARKGRGVEVHLMFIGPCIIAIVDERKTNLMSFAILFHLLCAQHVSDINISIFRSLRLC